MSLHNSLFQEASKLVEGDEGYGEDGDGGQQHRDGVHPARVRLHVEQGEVSLQEERARVTKHCSTREIREDDPLRVPRWGTVAGLQQQRG